MPQETPPQKTSAPPPAKSYRADREFSEDGSKLMEQAQRMSGLLGNWVMAANAGGIAFILTTRRELDATDQFNLAGAYSGFLWGAVLGFIGHVLLILSNSVMAWGLTRMSIAEEAIDRRTGQTAELAQQGISRPSEFDDMDAADRLILEDGVRRNAALPLAALGFLACAGSAVCALIGLASPLFSGML